MQISIGTFIKKQNSTMRPAGLDKTLNVELKRDTTIINPVFRLKGSSFSPSYNYVHVPAWNRYYFITNANYVIGDIVEVECAEDYGATWRDQIGSSSLYVLRSAAAYDGNIIDSMYPAKTNVIISNRSADSPFAESMSEGCYILGTVSKSATGTGAVTYYACTESEIRAFSRYLLSDINEYVGAGYIEDLSEDTLKALMNPFQYVVSCLWVPVTISGLTDTIKFGWYDSGVSARRCTAASLDFARDITISIPKHPQAAARGNYLNMEPFSRYELMFWPFGFVSLNAADLIKYDTLNLTVHMDVISGVGRLTISAARTGEPVHYIKSVPAQIGIQVQLAQVSTSFMGQVARIAGATISGIEALTGASEALGKAHGITSAVATASSKVDVTASGGGVTAVKQESGGKLILDATFLPVVDENNVENGRPLCKIRTLASLPGYQVIQEGDINMPGMDSERAAVKALLEGGYYYE